MFKFPDETERVMICGRTGSGKTVMGAWLLSYAPFDHLPYIIINHKCDGLLLNIPYAQTINMNDRIPTKPGIYQIFPTPGDDDGLENFLWRVRHRGGTGLVIDEGYELPPNSRAARAILTQGRSLHIPIIMLTQRPAWITKFLISEADYFSYFHLNDADDRDRIRRFTPDVWNVEEKTEEFHSRWYDVKRDFAAVLAPVPDRPEIYRRFTERLEPKRRWL